LGQVELLSAALTADEPLDLRGWSGLTPALGKNIASDFGIAVDGSATAGRRRGDAELAPA
jgi:hypothetical protein